MNKLRCLIGRPKTYRKISNGIDFAMCRSCHRQVEVHDETRIQMLLGYKW